MLSQTRAGAATSFQYDEVGNRNERVDYMGRKTKYTHDNLNRLTEIEYLPTTIAGGLPSSKRFHLPFLYYVPISFKTSLSNR